MWCKALRELQHVLRSTSSKQRTNSKDAETVTFKSKLSNAGLDRVVVPMALLA